MVWPFRRKPATAPEVQAQPEPQRAWREWTAVPPLEPVGLGGRPVSDPDRFIGGLATTWQQAPILQPLGHELSLAAPAGLASGVVAPVEGYLDAPELTWPDAPADAPELPELAVVTPLPTRAVTVAEAPEGEQRQPRVQRPVTTPPRPAAQEPAAEDQDHTAATDRGPVLAVPPVSASEARAGEEAPPPPPRVRRLGRIGAPLNIDPVPPAVLAPQPEDPQPAPGQPLAPDLPPELAGEPAARLASGGGPIPQAARPGPNLVPAGGEPSIPRGEGEVRPQVPAPDRLEPTPGNPLGTAPDLGTAPGRGIAEPAEPHPTAEEIRSRRPETTGDAAPGTTRAGARSPGDPAGGTAPGVVESVVPEPVAAERVRGTQGPQVTGPREPERVVEPEVQVAPSRVRPIVSARPMVSGPDAAEPIAVLPGLSEQPPPPPGPSLGAADEETSGTAGSYPSVAGMGFSGGPRLQPGVPGAPTTAPRPLPPIPGLAAASGRPAPAPGTPPLEDEYFPPPPGQDAAAPVGMPDWVAEALAAPSADGPLRMAPGAALPDLSSFIAFPPLAGPAQGDPWPAEWPAEPPAANPTAPRRRLGRIGSPLPGDDAPPDNPDPFSAGPSAATPFAPPSPAAPPRIGGMHPVPLAEDGEPLETDAMDGLDAEVIEADADAPEHSPEHLDALATQLYDRVRDRLRRELLVDRERSVTLTDWR
ncbi:MAG: hypothetical protein QOJ50_486 [Cryptosporangiaceae bacterium]|nr:hypothetical protein [Cryptosporangiaceae bacterium]